MRRRLAVGTVAAAALALAAPAAHAQGITLGSDGTTAPAFSYQDATRERVFIPVAGVDQNNDGVDDRVAIDIILSSTPAAVVWMYCVSLPRPSDV